MQISLKKILKGYHMFRTKYAHGNRSIMKLLSKYGQQPQVMVIACCDSRVDPGLILQCDPGELFVVRNIANIVPPYEKDTMHHGTSAALEYGVKFLKVKHLILLGHSQCGGMQALLDKKTSAENDFIDKWVSIIDTTHFSPDSVDECAQMALHQSHHNCLSFPWIAEKVAQKELVIHQWFFDIKHGQIFTYLEKEKAYMELEMSETITG
jgi:carbonic anhydrase